MKFWKNKWFKRGLYTVLILVLGLGIWYFELIVYGIGQGIGQMSLIWNAKTPEKFLAEGNYPDSVKVFYQKRLDLIRAIKRFAIDSLGLRASASYSQIYDQKGKPILWAVTASEPYALKAYEWSYGFLGNMPYKGYFDSTKAQKLAQELEQKGYDVNIYEPAAWSTLGWFNDPILSSMLHWSEGGLASLIIHEMTHSTIWINGNVEYNENLADFVGDYGAKLFLAAHFGKNSKQYSDFINSEPNSLRFYAHFLRGAEKLDSLYKNFGPKDSKNDKDRQKTALIRKIIEKLDTLALPNRKGYIKRFQKKLPNNAYFMNFRRYRSRQNQFEQEFKTKFNSNFKQYLTYLKEKY
ncbi:MAG: aminopeptidase [Microscillaceae bacterium]|jgi:predicted aminopeptidase|nr:aminopeptidase [Microscillaceae bacterium]